jgi:hypothetical protein
MGEIVLYERDGITVQALSPREEAEYKRLGFKKVEAEPAGKKPAKEAKPKGGE